MYSRIKIEVRKLNKTFGNNHVLQDIDLEIRSEESLVIIGGSGSGKSVLLKCLAGLLIPDSKSLVMIDHANVTFQHISKRSDFTKRFGMLFQGGALFDSLPVWHNVAFGLLRAQNVSKKQAKEIAIQKLTAVELKQEIADLYPSEISGGMQKRVAIARAIATEPQILFFDEPTAGLDPITAKAISHLIAGLSKKLAATTVTITHDINCMKTVADNIAVIGNGKIMWHGKAKAIANVQDEYIREFISA